ncbi:PREDICTED: atrial natriuretic peptide-converting enzyme-like [Priapulus caudatus]|uniref:Atrial natriuretic peptide-converting enzyme-like n=1 Tax=Priapulus caudatus TaxID=37621 RepID=A0ABM1DUE9_PRICU|nr:PREDICTED: atrial natriuretic peptide-converting enzyme-like [Priapulus caudatus]
MPLKKKTNKRKVVTTEANKAQQAGVKSVIKPLPNMHKLKLVDRSTSYNIEKDVGADGRADARPFATPAVVIRQMCGRGSRRCIWIILGATTILLAGLCLGIILFATLLHPYDEPDSRVTVATTTDQSYVWDVKKLHDSKGRCENFVQPLCLHTSPDNGTFVPESAEANHQLTAIPLYLAMSYRTISGMSCYPGILHFLCAMHVPRCGHNGNLLPPCRSFCKAAYRGCDFFFVMMDLRWPGDIDCDALPDSTDPRICWAYDDLKDPSTECMSGFLCDDHKCLQRSWRCDGIQDCVDGTDELNCSSSCTDNQWRCRSQQCVEKSQVCDGAPSCADDSDETNCIKIDKIGDDGEGVLKVYSGTTSQWREVCADGWMDTHNIVTCRQLGYRSAGRLESVVSNGTLYKMSPITISSSRIQQLLSLRDFKCKSGRAVFVRCYSYDQGIYSQAMKEVILPVINVSLCQKWYETLKNITVLSEFEFCAGYQEGGYDACQGDSGGPVLRLNDTSNRWEVVGIVSWGLNCGEPYTPGVFTRVPVFVDYIKNITELRFFHRDEGDG